jgi:hypothetical protein
MIRKISYKIKHKDKKTIFYNLIFSLGHVYTATGDYANALASHKQCVELIRSQLEDKLMVRPTKPKIMNS